LLHIVSLYSISLSCFVHNNYCSFVGVEQLCHEFVKEFY